MGRAFVQRGDLWDDLSECRDGANEREDRYRENEDRRKVFGFRALPDASMAAIHLFDPCNF